ncbi:enoyl-CoA hydratase/isomerase family protein [Lysinibacillus sp. LZ02]|uniref:enoyl-CoA hydratase/isomerase family protein n=1 Tax=Lysinibacillus sp. LZ02 TaxID=3420668 RepID=UPI003D36C2C8
MKKVLYSIVDNVAVITMNDEQSRNALSTQMTEELIAALTKANEDTHIGAIVLTGAGSSFCAGGNLAEFKQFLEMDVPELYEDGLSSTRLFQMRNQLIKPVIGAINGPALGGGTGLAALCHIAIGSEKSKLGLTELKLGLVPYVILPLVRRAVGERRMMELMLSARVLDANEAKEVGLLHEVVPHGQLLESALLQAKAIASYSPLGVKMALRAFEETAEMGVEEAMRVLSTMRLISFKSEDLREGAKAFLEKRSPQWSGK